jgi:hypothetical protein
MQVSHSSEVTPDVEFVSMDVTYEVGGVVV